ncbi:MAG TPA: right-handed parallel beta-helix repeat-containing protein, partial [Thermoanaerobaculia bacterium]
MLRLPLFALGLVFSASLSAAGTYRVTNTNDSGPGSLRDAILAANSGTCAEPCTITFKKAEAGAFVIEPLSALPPVTAFGLTIDGQSPYGYPPPVQIRGSRAGATHGLRFEGARQCRLLSVAIDGFTGHGVFIERAFTIFVERSQIGSAEHPNALDGVAILESNDVRLFATLILGNRGSGVAAVESNYVLTNANVGVAFDDNVVPNGSHGVTMHNCRDSGVGGRIVGNRGNGILVTGTSTNIFIGGETKDNGLLGIDLGGDGPTTNRLEVPATGPNHLQNPPVIETATYNQGWLRVAGSLGSVPNSTFFVTLFVSDAPDPSGYGEGDRYLPAAGGPESQRVSTDANGEARFELFVQDSEFRPVRDRFITATATRRTPAQFGEGGETSEYSSSIRVMDVERVFTITTTADVGPGSLRRVIDEVNDAGCHVMNPCLIAFAVDDPPVGGVFTIAPNTPLPPLTATGLTLDGRTQTLKSGETNPFGPEIEINGSRCAECDGLTVASQSRPDNVFRPDPIQIRDLTINGFPGHGFVVDAPNFPLVRIDGSYIGTDPTGTRAVPNGGAGIHARTYASISSFDNRFPGRPPVGSLVSGNRGNGIELLQGGRIGSTFVGTDRTGSRPVPNGGAGVSVSGPAILELNTIAFNRREGVRGSDAMVVTTSIHSNGLLGIDVGGSGVTPNDSEDTDGLTNHPVVHSVRFDPSSGKTEVELTHSAKRPSSTFVRYLIGIFASAHADGSGHGEGERLLSPIPFQPDATGRMTVLLDADLSGQFLTLTATPFNDFAYAPAGATSEFSSAVQVTAPGCDNVAPSLIAPLDQGAFIDDVQFAWTRIGAATGYRLWIFTPGEAARIAATTNEPGVSLKLPSKTYEWWVE